MQGVGGGSYPQLSVVLIRGCRFECVGWVIGVMQHLIN